MKFEFPDTGEGVTEGKFLEWKIEEGDKIEEDEIIGEAETDKAVVEIPAPADGQVKDLKVTPGDMVEVGEVIMELDAGEGSGEKDEQDNEEKSSENGEENNSGNPVVEDVPVSDNSETKSEKKETGKSSENPGEIVALPKVRKLAEEHNIDLAEIKTGERITEEDVMNAVEGENSQNTDKEQESLVSGDKTSKNVQATPSVRKLAREKEVDIEKVEGSGRGGKITRKDVENFSEDSGKPSKNSVSAKVDSHPVHSDRNTERVKMSGIKQKTADKMSESRFTAPHVTHVEKADITELDELRKSEKDSVDPHLTYLPFIMKSVSEALKNYPELNAELDTEKNEIVHKKYYDFNIAVDTDNGLLTPLIRNIDSKSIVELASEVGEKAMKAKDRELSPKELGNGTFSITNLGAIGGEEFTPIINYPQSAILGVGRIGETAEVVDGEIVPRTTVKFSLSYDHRVIDGATAARFMNAVVENLENPRKMLLEV